MVHALRMRARINVEVAQEDRLRLDRIVGDRNSQQKHVARVLYEDGYCRPGQAENHIKSLKTHLAADRTSCTKATANQLRQFLHAGAYWMMWGLRVSMPKRSMWRIARFDTLRLRLNKLAARVVGMKTMIKIHLPTSCPAQDILRPALKRIPCLGAGATGREQPQTSNTSRSIRKQFPC